MVPVASALIGAMRRAGHVRAEVEPVPLVDLLRHEQRQLVEQLAAAAVEDELQQVGVGGAEQLHARGLVHAAALDADEPVLDEVRGDPDRRACRRARSPAGSPGTPSSSCR